MLDWLSICGKKYSGFDSGGFSLVFQAVTGNSVNGVNIYLGYIALVRTRFSTGEYFSMVDKKNNESSDVLDDFPEYWSQKTELQKKGKKLFTQKIYRDWCKACGLCIAFCPTDVYEREEGGKPVVVRPDDCIGCRFCELHCPDFAITIEERFPDRRKGER